MLESVLQELESLGTEQNRKIYLRHGVGENQYGVSYGNLKTLAKKYKKQHALALELWQTGNHDARILALMIADPKQATDEMLESWKQALDNYVITDAVSDYISKTPFALAKMEAWTASDDEWIGAAGWNVMAHLASNDSSLPDDYFFPYLDTIRQTIHNRPNRTRYSMNSALIAIGTRSNELEAYALEVARQIGLVMVDHGETGCKTPNAIEYIPKARQHKASKS